MSHVCEAAADRTPGLRRPVSGLTSSISLTHSDSLSLVTACTTPDKCEAKWQL
jgi:hypothetical protein